MKNFFHPHEISFPTDKNRLEMQYAYIQIVMICACKCVIFAIIKVYGKLLHSIISTPELPAFRNININLVLPERE